MESDDDNANIQYTPLFSNIISAIKLVLYSWEYNDARASMHFN